MPRTAKPPAIPVEMPRTEADFDILLSAIEVHAEAGHRIGTLVRDGKISKADALDEAAICDNALYDVADQVAEARAAQFTREDDQLLRDAVEFEARPVNDADSQRRRLAMLATRPSKKGNGVGTKSKYSPVIQL